MRTKDFSQTDEIFYYILFFSAKILVAGTSVEYEGKVQEDITQVIDLADPKKICDPLDKLEYNMHVGAAYGLLDNAYPIFCGGRTGGMEREK